MSVINDVKLIGRIVRDTIISVTNEGGSYLPFSLAVNNQRKKKDGTWEDVPIFVSMCLWGTHAAKMQPCLKKGTLVAVRGHLETSRWVHAGEELKTLSVFCDELKLLSPGQKNGKESPVSPQENESFSNDGEGVIDDYNY